jgi:hypothetical protein
MRYIIGTAIKKQTSGKLEPEVFVPIVGYERGYAIGSHGNVYSISKQIIMQPFVDKDDYLIIKLSKRGHKRNFKISRLVALHFISNPENKEEVNHLKGKRDNYYKHLAWATPKENVNHAFEHGLNNSNHCRHRVKSTHVATGEQKTFDSLREAETILNISRGCVSSVLLGKCNQTKGYKFEKL